MLNISYFQLAAAIMGMLAVLMIMLMYLLIRKKMEQKRIRNITSMKESLRPLLIEEMIKGNDSGTDRFKKDAVFVSAVEDNLKEFSSNLDSSSYKKTIAETAEKYLADSIEKDLSSSRWGDRINALTAIKDFQMYSFVPQLWTLYEKQRTSVQEKNLILQTAAGADDSRLLEVLISSPPYQSTFFYKQIIRRVSPEMLDTIISRFTGLPPGFRVAVLSYIGEKRELPLLRFVENCLESEDHEVRVNALKAIRSIGFITNPQSLHAFSFSESWVEQMSFAQAAGELVHPIYKERLIELLASSNWWVRYYAGEALSKYKDGKGILKESAANHQDAFARDMASQWLGSV
ncbi:HEAT repeat domain-containing protein [Bacillus sp. AK031]